MPHNMYIITFSTFRSRTNSRGTLYKGTRRNSSKGSFDSQTNSQPGSRRCSKPSILVEPDPETYGWFTKHYIIIHSAYENKNFCIIHLISITSICIARLLTYLLSAQFGGINPSLYLNPEPEAREVSLKY